MIITGKHAFFGTLFMLAAILGIFWVVSKLPPRYATPRDPFPMSTSNSKR